jgi:hypothetical protein
MPWLMLRACKDFNLHGQDSDGQWKVGLAQLVGHASAERQQVLVLSACSNAFNPKFPVLLGCDANCCAEYVVSLHKSPIL